VLAPLGQAHIAAYIAGDVSQRRARCDDGGVTKLWRICVVTIALMATAPAVHAAASTPPPAPPTTVFNDLLPDNNSVSNCVGTVEQANCGSKARADGHTYLVFLALAAGLSFIGWRIARGVKAGDAARESTP
jgi:hypothetical protein